MKPQPNNQKIQALSNSIPAEERGCLRVCGDSGAAPMVRIGMLVHEDAGTIDDGDFNSSGWANGPGGHNQPTRIHAGGACVIYCDLHAKWQSQDALLDELKSGSWNPYMP